MNSTLGSSSQGSESHLTHLLLRVEERPAEGLESHLLLEPSRQEPCGLDPQSGALVVDRRGDQLVEIVVVIPADLGDAERALYRRLQELAMEAEDE